MHSGIKKIAEDNIYVLKLIKKYSKALIVCNVFIVFFELISVITGMCIGAWIFDYVKVVGATNIILGILGIGFITLAISFATSIIKLKILPIAGAKISEKMFEKILKASFEIEQSEFECAQFYDKYQRALDETAKRPSEVMLSVKNMLSSLLQIVIVIWLAYRVNAFIAIFLICSSIINSVFSKISGDVNYKQYKERTVFSRKYAYIQRLIYQPEYEKELKVCSSIKTLLVQKMDENIKAICLIVRKYFLKLLFISSLDDIVNTFLVSIVPFIYVVVSLANDYITIGQAVLLISASNIIPNVYKAFFESIVSFKKNSMYIANYREVIEKPSKKAECKEKNTDVVLSLQQVSFSYNESAPFAIKNVSLDIREKQHIALVGENGMGKTTICNLLMGLYSPSEGCILLNGNNIIDIERDTINHNISILNQDYVIFSFTIAENILLRTPQSNDDYVKVENALKKVGLYNRIIQTKRMYDSFITKEFSDEGIYLSGGEMQRLAIARLYVSEAKCIILDEPTSALDPKMENRIMQMIKDLFYDRILIVVSHRLSAIMDFEKICYIREGKISEMGNHKKLVEQGGDYCELFNAQAKKYQSYI